MVKTESSESELKVPESLLEINQDEKERSQIVISLSNEPDFDLIVIGCGGGPREDDLSSYFLKSHLRDWKEGFTGIEAGSGLGSVIKLLEKSNSIEKGYGPFWDFDLPPYSTRTTTTKTETKTKTVPETTTEEVSISRLAGSIYSSLTSFCITHSHFDHIASLVLSAGALLNTPKSVWGSDESLNRLSYVFEAGLWPRLANFDYSDQLALWLRRFDSEKEPVTICPSIELQARPIAHGTFTPQGSHPCCPSIPNATHQPNGIDSKSTKDLKQSASASSIYHSSAFFITHQLNQHQFIFFGDLGPDSITGLNLNRKVWEEAALSFKAGNLKTIFIECSYDSSRPAQLLYGHLSPPFLFEELVCFANLVSSTEGQRNKLVGLNVVIIHIKEDITPIEIGPSSSSLDIREKILNEILDLESNQFQLGCKFWVAKQGDRFEF
ncbi:cyclic-AMP phosphodiesterase [Melampsora americana]|nr:cyclic-AMP phosphodiesterase [Melampsora americana]